MGPFRKARADATGFYDAGQADAVRENEMTVVKVAGKKIIVTRWQGRLIAFDHACPHAAADLSRGELHRGRVVCPDHDYKFDIVNGRTLWPPDELVCLKRYDVREDGGLLKIRVPS